MAQWIRARLPPLRPEFDSRTSSLMWVEFVVGSRLAPRVFHRVFLPPQKPTLLNSNSIWARAAGLSMSTLLGVYPR